MRYYKKLVGKRIYLSPISLKDIDKFTEWINDMEISINLGVSSFIMNEDDQREIIESRRKSSHYFAIINKENDELIGNCELMSVDMLNRRAELGIFIGNKEYWGKAIGEEAINLLLDYGFNILNLNNIMLKVFSYNKRAIKLYEKCGFKVIGKRREAAILGDNKYDEIYMDILSSEYEGNIINIIEN